MFADSRRGRAGKHAPPSRAELLRGYVNGLAKRQAGLTPEECDDLRLRIVGDWSQCVVGMFGLGIRIDVNPNQSFTTGVGAARVVLECDVAATQPSAFERVASVS